MERNTMNEGDTLRYRRDGSIADSFTDAVMSYHQPELTADSHVYMLFNDGEINMQKAGPLLWNRSLRMTAIGYEQLGQAYVQIPKDNWPGQFSGFGFIFCTREQAEMLRWHMGEV